MNIFQLQCFMAVAEHLSFARAAEQLHITHPAVSQQIQSLEKELNTRLFTRTTRTVKLTEEGKAFINDASEMIAISQRAKKRFENANNRDIQVLSIGCYYFSYLFKLSAVLKELALLYPNIHPRLRVVPFQHIYRYLEEGDIDAVIGFKEPDSMKISANYKEINKTPLVCICPKDHPLSNRKSVSLEDLKKEGLVLFTPMKVVNQIAHLHSYLMGGNSPSDLYFCESVEAIMVLVSSGFGISVLPDLFINKTDLVNAIPLEGVEPISFGVYYKSIQDNKALRDMIKIMKSKS